MSSITRGKFSPTGTIGAGGSSGLNLPHSSLSQTAVMRRVESVEKQIAEMVQKQNDFSRFQIDAEAFLRGAVQEDQFRKGLVLVFSEFDQKLCEAFEDFGRKVLQLFVKNNDWIALKEKVNVKIGWPEHERVLKGLNELKDYVDWRREDLAAHFSTKADASDVGVALKGKASAREVGDLKNQVQRIESVLSHMKLADAAKITRNEQEEKERAEYRKFYATFGEKFAAIENNYATFNEKLEEMAEKVASLNPYAILPGLGGRGKAGMRGSLMGGQPGAGGAPSATGATAGQPGTNGSSAGSPEGAATATLFVGGTPGGDDSADSGLMSHFEIDEKIRFIDGVVSDLINESDTTVEAVVEIQKITKKLETKVDFLMDRLTSMDEGSLFQKDDGSGDKSRRITTTGKGRNKTEIDGASIAMFAEGGLQFFEESDDIYSHRRPSKDGDGGEGGSPKSSGYAGAGAKDLKRLNTDGVDADGKKKTSKKKSFAGVKSQVGSGRESRAVEPPSGLKPANKAKSINASMRTTQAEPIGPNK